MYFMAQLLENCTFKRRILFFGFHGLLFGLQWQNEKNAVCVVTEELFPFLSFRNNCGLKYQEF